MCEDAGGGRERENLCDCDGLHEDFVFAGGGRGAVDDLDFALGFDSERLGHRVVWCMIDRQTDRQRMD